jgi:hypothetical protein
MTGKRGVHEDIIGVKESTAKDRRSGDDSESWGM